MHTNLSNIKVNITRKALLEAISNPIYIEHELEHVFMVKTTFSKYTEVDEIFNRLIKIKIPDEEAWIDLCDYQEEQEKDYRSDSVNLSQHQICQQSHYNEIKFSSTTSLKKRTRCPIFLIMATSWLR